MTLNAYIAEHILEIVKKLVDAGYETYIVGGAVRDLLVGRKPKDYDISTAGTPKQIVKVFGKKNTFIIGKRFKLVHLHYGSEIIEISTFRKKPSGFNLNKLPKVLREKIRKKQLPENLIVSDNEFGTSREDAFRRDFTVNAIFYDPINENLVDHTGLGLEDLNQGIIRCIGDPKLRFEEDPVRILRALKLIGQYGFEMEATTESALMDSMPLILHAAKSRLNLEFQKILVSCYSHKIIPVFRKYGFLKYFLPFFDEHWTSRSTDVMLKLLRKRNERVEKGFYRPSISLGIAVMAIPYLEEKMGVDYGEFYKKCEEFHAVEIRHFVRNTLRPRIFPRRVIDSTLKILLLHPELLKHDGDKTYDNNKKVSGKRKRKYKKKGEVDFIFRNKKYAHAREFLAILNAVIWRSKKLMRYWPPVVSKLHK